MHKEHIYLTDAGRWMAELEGYLIEDLNIKDKWIIEVNNKER